MTTIQELDKEIEEYQKHLAFRRVFYTGVLVMGIFSIFIFVMFLIGGAIK